MNIDSFWEFWGFGESIVEKGIDGSSRVHQQKSGMAIFWIG